MFCYNHMMSHLAVFALGPLRLEIEGQALQTSRHKALALLVYLAWHPERQSRQALSALFWPDYTQEKAFAYLRRTLWELQHLLGEGWLEADRASICINPTASLSLDVAEFKSNLDAIHYHHHSQFLSCPSCIAHLHTAALLYRGDFLDGFSLRDSAAFEDWQREQREALRSDYARALQKLADLLFQSGAYNEAIGFAQRWLALDMFNEEAHRLLMKAYACNEQRHQAVRQYQECSRLLQTELGIPPSAKTTTLYEAIVSGIFTPASEPPQQPSENRAQATIGNETGFARIEETLSTPDMVTTSSMPIPSTPFVGRQQELAQIATLLADPGCWLLTLVGPGGIGKTRLAIETGLRQMKQNDQRVCFIPLGVVETESSLIPAIARATGLVLRQNGPNPAEQLMDFLREKRLLLILDAFEGLVQWASLLDQMHAHAAGIRMLVTSRQRLKLPGEWVMEVEGLEYPEGQHETAESTAGEVSRNYEAVEFFLQAARRARLTFQASSEDLATIQRIARLLEGMPLGLELAAVWVNTLSCVEIADEIHRGLDFLETSRWQDVELSQRPLFPQRPLPVQRSIRAVFNHSWDLLSPGEKTILPRLSIFRGSFTRQAAEQVAGISLRALAGLVDQSLVRRTPQGRFDLHDLLRQYCTEKLDQQPADCLDTHRRHCAFFTACLAQWNASLTSEGQGQALREMESDIENFQAAWDWAVAQRQIEPLEQAVDGLCMFYLRRGRFAEGQGACQAAIEAVYAAKLETEKTLYARLSSRLRIWQAAFYLNLERFEQTKRLLWESQSILDDPELDPRQLIAEQVFMLVIRAILANQQYDPAATLENYRQAYSLSKAQGKDPAFYIFFWRYLMAGTPSRELYTQIEKQFLDREPGGDPFEQGCLLFVLGIAELFHTFRMEKAESLLMESCQHFLRVEDSTLQAMVFMTQGYLLSVQGKFAEGYMLKQRELAIYQDIGDRRMIGIALAEIGEYLCHLGKYPEAEEHIRKGIAFLQGRSEMQVALRHRYLGDVLLAQGKYTEAQAAYRFSYQFFQSKNDPGWMLTALTGLSRVELALGDRSGAWKHASEALQIYQDVKIYTFFFYQTLAEIALLLIDQEEIVQAAEFYALVVRQGYLARSRWFADLYGRLIEEAVAKLPLDEQTVARERAQTLDISTLTLIA